MDTDFYSVVEVAQKLGVEYITVLRMIKRGQIKAYKIGKQYKINIDDYDKFIKDAVLKVEVDDNAGE